MSNRRKRKSRRPPQPAPEPRITVTVPGAAIPPRPCPPGAHPGSDRLTVIWPDVELPPGLHGAELDAWLEDIPPGAVTARSAEVSRDEFTRRMAGSGVVAQVNADWRHRVIALADPDAIIQWTQTMPRAS